jgi:nicotinate-nucleotide--dimethylbenzimidazole phosphoribosyltransferase
VEGVGKGGDLLTFEGPYRTSAEQEHVAGRGLDEEARDALWRVFEARRDVRRRFLPEQVRDDVMQRVLRAAHMAPSVGLSQPWDFLLITDTATKRRVVEHVEEQRRKFSASLSAARAQHFDRLKIEAILSAPLNVVVTSTLERGGARVLGRHAQPETATYSTCLAIENLWLAARAEGLGVGWVSFYKPAELAAILGLPRHVSPVAYLCVGYVESFDTEPELALEGWASPRPLSWSVHRESWGRREGPRPFEEAAAAVAPPDPDAMRAAAEHHRRLTKPPGSLGELEEIGVRLAGIARRDPPPIPEPATVAVFAADHGVASAGVTPWPSEVTAQMVANFCAGGAAINAVARNCGADVLVVDVGVASELDPAPGLVRRKVRAGTRDLSIEPAMTRGEAAEALDVGAEMARELVAAGNRCLLTGDMGIGNTTPSAALIAYFSNQPPSVVTGRGTGVDDDTWRRKVEVVEASLDRTSSTVERDDVLGALASLGGLEIAAVAGFIVGGAAAGVPVLIDGVIAAAAAMVASALSPVSLRSCFAGHLSAEPGARVALERLGLTPILDLHMRLGEGTGACLALPVLQAGARVLAEMATFDEAGVTEKQSR